MIPTSLFDKDPHGWGAVQRGVGPMLIVGGDPGRQGLEAGRVAEIEAHVGPLREQGLDEALGFAVGLGPIGARDQVAGTEPGGLLMGEDIPNFQPRGVLFQSDRAEALQSQALFSLTAEPRRVQVYDTPGHGIELLKFDAPRRDFVAWLAEGI